MCFYFFLISVIVGINNQFLTFYNLEIIKIEMEHVGLLGKHKSLIQGALNSNQDFNCAE